MNKTLKTIGIIALVIVVFIVGLIIYTNLTSKKMKCTSPEGSITILYNDKTLTGYTVVNMTYDLDGQREIAEKIGVEAYLDEFDKWFRANTTGTCKR